MSGEYDTTYVIMKDEKVKEYESKCFMGWKKSLTIKQSTCICSYNLFFHLSIPDCYVNNVSISSYV